MRVILSSPEYDPLGSVELAALPATAWGKTERRVNRVKTLDGGYALSDGGSAECDRAVRLVWDSDRLLDEAVARLVRLYPKLHCATPLGLFLAVPSTLEATRGKTQLDLLVLAKLSD